MGRPKHSLRSAVSAVAVAQALSSSPAHASFSLGPKLVRHRANGLKNMHFDEHLAGEYSRVRNPACFASWRLICSGSSSPPAGQVAALD
jgi:hypothetical protein